MAWQLTRFLVGELDGLLINMLSGVVQPCHGLTWSCPDIASPGPALTSRRLKKMREQSCPRLLGIAMTKEFSSNRVAKSVYY